ncbi:MAG: oligosaccharide flippase family protein [Anaerolineales bacterium]|nr:oligosaccharide flippase family protein [Anaerolineales bacterium]
MPIKKIVNDFKKDLTGKTGRQTSTLFLTQIAAFFLGIFTGIINTRTLGPEGYGILAFFFSVTSFTVLFFRFGFFSASGLLIAQAKEERKERELIGASIVAAFFIGVSYAIFIFVLSFFVDDIFHTDVGWILRGTSILLIPLPCTFLIPQIGRGTNKIERLAAFNVVPTAFYLVGALVLLKMIQIEPFHFIFLHLFATIFGIFVVIKLFHPVFSNVKNNLREIWKKTKEYGFHLYMGQITTQSAYKLDKIFITFFVNTTQLGFYSLALSITSPMVGLSSALSMSLFKGFVEMDRIPKKVIYYNFLWLAVGIIGLVIFGKYIVVLLFTEKFLPSVSLILPLALACLFQGMYQPYISFLGAKGLGVEMRNAGFIASAVYLATNIIFIPPWGAYGAAVATAISTAFALLINIYIYKKYLYSGGGC